MTDILFLQSDIADPYAFYAQMLARQPLYYDAQRRIWGVYSYAACQAVLACSDAYIPPRPTDEGLADPAAALLRNLVRLSNPPAHAGLRAIASRLFDGLRPARTQALLEQLLEGQRGEMDWVETVCKQLPALAVMHALGMEKSDIGFLLSRLERLTKIMLPDRSEAQRNDINTVAAELWPLFEAHARHIGGSGEPYAANLAGLLIQNFDAGRGLLSNVLLQALARPLPAAKPQSWRPLVLETLRYDPPIQNTRRTMKRDAEVDGVTLHAGEAVLVVLASANRDPAVFTQPDRFDCGRLNNDAQLGFGTGAHACIARQFAVQLAVDALAAIAARRVRLLPQEIRYEPLVNARLPRTIRIGME